MPSPIDLATYFSRIGFGGTPRPDFETLEAIQWGHSSNIPFENLSVLRDLPILLDEESLHAKLVQRGEGGYCFEQNGLLLAILQQIGFDAHPLSARIRMGMDREFTPARTHLFVKVLLDGQEWLLDAGAGGMSLTSPIRFIVGEEQETRHEPRKIIRENGVMYQQALMGDEWVDVFEFTGEHMPVIDREVGNWWTSTNPRSKFKNGLFCALAKPKGERIGILNDTFTHRRGAEVLRRETIRSLDNLHEILRREFNLHYPDGTEFGAAGSPWRDGP